MAVPRVDRAAELVAELRGYLDAADLPKVMATLDARDIGSGARHGIIVVSPPRLKFPTWNQVLAEWDVHVIAGPPDNYLAAWALIDTIVDTLHAAGLPMETAEAGQFEPLAGPPLWAYTISFTESN